MCPGFLLGEDSSLMLYLRKNVFDLQQQNFKQKVVALLKRFKVSDEVSNACWKPSCLHIALFYCSMCALL